MRCGFARIAFHHAIADEAIADLRQHRRLAQRLGEIHDGADRRRRGLRRAHDFEQRHDVRRREEVHADHVLRAVGRRGDLLDVQRRGVGREHGARASRRDRACAKILVLQRHVLEDGFDDHVRSRKVAVRRARRRIRASRCAFSARCQAAALDHRLVGSLDGRRPALQGCRIRHRAASPGSRHWRSRSRCRRPSCPRRSTPAGSTGRPRAIVGQARNPARFALGEEGVHGAFRLGALLALVDEHGFRIRARQRTAYAPPRARPRRPPDRH